jgi:glycosyltransferase involved in cell wall biosynthesis
VLSRAKGESVTEPEPTRILYVAHDTGLIGGAERQLLELLRGLDRQRFEPHLVCLESGGPVAQGAAEYGVPVTHVTRKWRWDFGVAARIRDIIRENAIDIVHAYLGLPGIYGAIGGRLAGAKVITTIRIAGPRGKPSDIGERLAFLVSDRIIANSRAGAEYYFRWLPGLRKTVIIYNGYDLSDFDLGVSRSRQELGLPAEGLLIGHVANLSVLKDYPTFIKSLALVFREEPACHAVIVGDGIKRAEYEGIAASLGIKNKVLFLGHRSDVLDLVRTFDVCVLASHPRYREGLSNSIAEYMGLRKPVVAADIGGNRELVRDGKTGFLCKGGDPADMAAKILVLLRDAELRRRMGTRGREFFEANLTLERMVGETQRVYEELMSR